MTAKACVIGFPVKHSRSPMIHGFWLKQAGIAGSYGREEVAPEDFVGFIEGFAGAGYVGGNVTVPHKQAAFRLVQVEDPVALALEAVNTLWFEDGVLKGANTDVEGFLANLDQAAPGWDAPLGKAVVLGAGGAARAVVQALLWRGAERVMIVNLSKAGVEALAEKLGPGVVAAGWGEVAGALDGAACLVNTTSLGMRGQPP